jgi:hypothetical protein
MNRDGPRGEAHVLELRMDIGGNFGLIARLESVLGQQIGKDFIPRNLLW